MSDKTPDNATATAEGAKKSPPSQEDEPKPTPTLAQIIAASKRHYPHSPDDYMSIYRWVYHIPCPPAEKLLLFYLIDMTQCSKAKGYIDANGEPYVHLSASRIAKIIGCERHAIGRYLSNLESLGIIRREPDTIDVDPSDTGQHIQLVDWRSWIVSPPPEKRNKDT